MSNSSPSLLRTALATGTALAGAYAGLSAAKWAYQRNLSSSLSLPPALALSPRPFEAPDGRVQCYARAGSGPPVVVLHSFNAVASSRELAPVVEHVASKTDRPIYALDWLGFGRSERAAIDYRPGVYRRQLYHFLTEVPRTPVDLIALSLGSEYAAQVALQLQGDLRSVLAPQRQRDEIDRRAGNLREKVVELPPIHARAVVDCGPFRPPETEPVERVDGPIRLARHVLHHGGQFAARRDGVEAMQHHHRRAAARACIALHPSVRGLEWTRGQGQGWGKGQGGGEVALVRPFGGAEPCVGPSEGCAGGERSP